jgi:hypothetical protein
VSTEKSFSITVAEQQTGHRLHHHPTRIRNDHRSLGIIAPPPNAIANPTSLQLLVYSVGKLKVKSKFQICHCLMSYTFGQFPVLNPDVAPDSGHLKTPRIVPRVECRAEKAVLPGFSGEAGGYVTL